MDNKVRPRRSALYLPGSNARALEKGKTLPADALIFDLEDAVAPDAKEKAREQICEALKAGGYGPRERIVRVNGLATPWGHADIAAAASSGADAVLLPKVEGPGIVRQVLGIMDAHGAPRGMTIWCMMETPLAVLHAERIAAASSRLGGLVMGTSDLTNELHGSHTRTRLPILTSLSLCVLAARAFGVAIIDGVQLDLKDAEGFAEACRQGAELGFDGKTLVHPSQIAPANEAFGPSEEELAFSRRIIEAYETAQAEGQGVVVVDGRLVENLHVENARRLLALAEAIDEIEAAAAE